MDNIWNVYSSYGLLSILFENFPATIEREWTSACFFANIIIVFDSSEQYWFED